MSSVEACFSTALDMEEVSSGAGSDQLHVMVADVIKSFDTVDRSTLDRALGRLGLLHWFRKVHLAFHSQVRLRFELAAGAVMGASRTGALLERSFLSPCMSPGLSLCPPSGLNYMLTTRHVDLGALVPYSVLLGSQFSM